MRKSVLEQNILPKAKQYLTFTDLPSAEIIHITRGDITMEYGVINLKDQTRVPGGRLRAFDFEVEIQFARNPDRRAYMKWWEECQDRPGQNGGVTPNYKKEGTITYGRLFRGSPGTSNSGSDSPPVQARLAGCWPSKFILPGGDIDADNGDGDCIAKITINADSVRLLN